MSLNVRRLLSRLHAATLPIIRFNDASVYAPGTSHRAKPVITSLNWTVNDGEAWAVVEQGSNTSSMLSGKEAIIQMLLGHMRISPAGSDPLPFLLGEDSREAVHSVAFSTRPRSWGSDFYDYTSRYGAARDGEATTFRSVLRNAGAANVRIDELATKLEVNDLLDLPIIALSNGQTRRARVLQALLRIPSPKLLILDEPLTGLDPHARPLLSELLYSLHETKSPRIILALRAQDPLPQWITSVLKVTDDRAEVVRAESFTPTLNDRVRSVAQELDTVNDNRDIIVNLTNVNVKYHERHVLRDVTWKIQTGDKWHLQGFNGSGKTTLTALITGAHPQSFTNAGLHLFGLPRRKIATPTLAQRIGHTSPEIAAALPRRASMTVADVVSTGFDGHYAYRPRAPEETARVHAVLRKLEITPEAPITSLAPGELATALLARALVGRPRLVILDEAFMGMTDEQVVRATQWLREECGSDCAVIWIGHWENECPWDDKDSLKRIRLADGYAKVLR